MYILGECLKGVYSIGGKFMTSESRRVSFSFEAIKLIKRSLPAQTKINSSWLLQAFLFSCRNNEQNSYTSKAVLSATVVIGKGQVHIERCIRKGVR